MSRALSRLNVYHMHEIHTAEGYSVDIILPERRIALEVDGPHHFTQHGKPTGATVLKRRQLRATGWSMVAIPYYEWYRMNGNGQQECEYLFNMIMNPAHPTHADYTASWVKDGVPGGW